VAIVRAQSGLPALGEVLEPFAFPHLVSGWMRGSHNGPIMPVPLNFYVLYFGHEYPLLYYMSLNLIKFS